MRKARERGIKVLTFDADAEPDARDFFVNQATPEGIGRTLMDNAARVLGGKGEFAIITASLTAANMIEWQKCIEQRRKEKYPQIKMAALRPCDDLQKKAFDEANTIMNADPGVKLIMAICSPAVPGAAEAVKQSGRTDVKVIGLGLPNDNKRYVHEGITDCVVLWNTMDLGYLTVQAARALADGTLKRGDTSSRPAGSTRSRSRATTSCSASRSSSPKRTSTSSTSDRPRTIPTTRRPSRCGSHFPRRSRRSCCSA